MITVEHHLTEHSNKVDLEDFIKKHSKFIHSVTWRYSEESLEKIGYTREDLYMAGILGLLKAYKNFDIKKGKNITKDSKFKSYAFAFIVGDIKRAVRESNSLVRYPRSIKELAVKIAKIDDRPNNKELSKMFMCEEEKVEAALQFLQEIRSSSEIVAESNGDIVLLGDCIEFNQDYTSIYIDDFMRYLPEQWKEILQIKMNDTDKIQREIAQIVGCSPIHVSRVLKAIGIMYENYLNGEEVFVPKTNSKKY